MGARWSAAASLAAVVIMCVGCGSSPAPQGDGRAPDDPTAVRAAFIKGLNGFCRAFYEDQKRVDERYPTLAVRGRYDRAQAAGARRDDRMLTGLHPLPAMSHSFSRFVANEKALYRARVAAITADADGRTAVADDAFNRAIDRRHSMAGAYGAHECDGLLPLPQRRAAVAALRRYELNRDPHRACFTLVSPEFTKTQFPSPDPDATCLQHFNAQYSGLYPLPTGIRVSSVSGVENLSATVHFTEVPDCGCGDLASRLYFDHGRWLIRDGYHE